MFVFIKCEQMVFVDNTFLFDGSVKNSKESVVSCMCRVLDHFEYGYELRCFQVLQRKKE